MSEVKLSQLWAPTFNSLHQSMRGSDITHYILSGGRASGKSSFVSLEIIYGIMRESSANAIVYRKVGETISTTVFNQLIWAIDALGVNGWWKVTSSPYELTYMPTGQKILFRGLDKAEKTKGIKLAHGYFKYIWFEELTEFKDLDEIETTTRSLVRGDGGHSNIIYTYNPPKSANSWVNSWAIEPRSDKLKHHSTYLDIPEKWLGPQFIQEAYQTLEKNEAKYRWAYLGEITGFGGAIFDNLKLRTITDKDISSMEYFHHGLDFGYSVDPTAYLVTAYDKALRKLFVVDEFYSVNASYDTIALAVNRLNPQKRVVIADSAEPRSIAELKDRGIKIVGAKKGQGSVEHGIKWLQDLDEIVIDANRTPNAAREFAAYEYERDRHGNFKASYPDAENHTIDAIRYGNEGNMIKKDKWGWS